MADQSKTKSTLIAYILDNKFMFLVALYMAVSVILKATTTIDITIPCIWSSIFDVKCLGCGTTRAFICLLKFDFAEAISHNIIIFPLLIFGSYYIIKDYIKFKNNRKSKK